MLSGASRPDFPTCRTETPPQPHPTSRAPAGAGRASSRPRAHPLPPPPAPRSLLTVVTVSRAAGHLLGVSPGRDGGDGLPPRARTERGKVVSAHEIEDRGFRLAQNVGERQFRQGMAPRHGPGAAGGWAAVWPDALWEAGVPERTGRGARGPGDEQPPPPGNCGSQPFRLEGARPASVCAGWRLWTRGRGSSLSGLRAHVAFRSVGVFWLSLFCLCLKLGASFTPPGFFVSTEWPRPSLSSLGQPGPNGAGWRLP